MNSTQIRDPMLREPSLVLEDRPFPGPGTRRLAFVAGAVGILALGGSLLLGVLMEDGIRRFLYAYLMNYAYFLSLSLGALFFVALQHLTRASWSVVVRRLAEIVGTNLLLLAVLLIPIVIGIPRLYEWADPETVRSDETLLHKGAYLNTSFFIFRCLFYAAVWVYLARYFIKRSVEQDTSGDIGLTLRMERFSAPALIVYGLTVTFAAFDLLMSLDPHWYSTIYGVYFFAGGAVGFLALLTIVAMILQRNGHLVRTITIEHYHDLGKLLFAFVFFWAYIAFSQYLLIWYANIPEETEWFHTRQSGPWGGLALVLVFGHFVLPFLGLLSRRAKRRKASLAFWAGWMLLIHWIDLYWLVMPELNSKGLPFHLIDIGCLIGLGGFFLAAAVRTAGKNSLVPLNDPRLTESLRFENA